MLESDDRSNVSVKVTDFGFATFFDPKKGAKEVLGSPLYMAPEIIKHQTYTEKVDIWSLGVITFILLSGCPPFKGRSKQQMEKSIVHDTIEFT